MAVELLRSLAGAPFLFPAVWRPGLLDLVQGLGSVKGSLGWFRAVFGLGFRSLAALKAPEKET